MNLNWLQIMKKIMIATSVKTMLADVFTPVGIYLRLRDRFRDTVLLESTDNHVAENSYSVIGIHAIAGAEISAKGFCEQKLPLSDAEKIPLDAGTDVPEMLRAFMDRFECLPSETDNAAAIGFAQGLFGYTSYDAVRFFDEAAPVAEDAKGIALMRYRLYQYVVVVNHHRDELYLCENKVQGLESKADVVESLIRGRDVPGFPFSPVGEESSDITDDDYLAMVEKGIKSCLRGDVFQIVLSRRFQQRFRGDEFNVYRALRSVNPSPYLFYFDYGDYRLMGSSPESQLIVKDGTATVHPIAGTFKRTGNDDLDLAAAKKLLSDPKENAEHVMLVDLARNDLSRACDQVAVKHFREVKYYSHVIHLVSEVQGRTPSGTNPFRVMAKTFPAGTLSGAPKIKAMQLIGQYEATPRGYYGGAIGHVGFNGSFNHAIMIRTFLSRNNTLIYRAGAGVVAASVPASELQEVGNKLGALKKAVSMASSINGPL